MSAPEKITCDCCGTDQLATEKRSVRINHQSSISVSLCASCESIGVHTFAATMVDAALIVQADQKPSGLTAEIMDQGWP